MKKLLPPLFILLFITASKAQFTVNDTVNFENQNNHITIPTDSTSGQWQIGPPQKNVFINPLAGNNSIVTDTAVSYQPGLKSIFYLYPLDLSIQQLSFTHSMNADSLHAGGYIEISYDNINWYNILDTAFLNNFTSLEGNWGDEIIGLGGSSTIKTLFNGKKGFTGNFTAKTYSFAWGFYPLIKAGFNGGTFRFVFESDSLTTPLDGWMLDNFYLEATQLYSVSEILSKAITIYPNQANDKLAFSFDENKFKPTELTITNVVGQKVFAGPFQKTLDISTLQQGVYYVTITDAKGNAAAKMFYKQ